MGVDLKIRVVKGWKQEENQRFGVCLVMQFKDSETGKQLFEYAPTLDEQDEWGKLFNAVLKIDELHKQAIQVCSVVDPDFDVGKFNSKCGGKVR